MKILILGGTSFFGKETANLLAESGHEVTVFSRRSPVGGMSLDINQQRGDRTVATDLTRMSVETWDAVIDNICYTAEDAQKAISIFNGRTGLYLFTSSASVYTLLQNAVSPFRENLTELLPKREKISDTPLHRYATGKLEAEKLFLQAQLSSKFPVVTIRPPIVIGPADPTLRAYSYWLRLADGGPLLLPRPDLSSNYVFSTDLAKGYQLLIEKAAPCKEVYNLADPCKISLIDFVKHSARILHKDPEILSPETEWLKTNDFDFSSSPFSERRDFILSIEKAEKDLQWQTTPLHIWLQDTINWFFFKYLGPMPKNYSNRKKEMALAELYKKEKQS